MAEDLKSEALVYFMAGANAAPAVDSKDALISEFEVLWRSKHCLKCDKAISDSVHVSVLDVDKDVGVGFAHIVCPQDSEIDVLRLEFARQKYEHEIALRDLNHAVIHNRYLNDELSAMEKSHATETKIHRDVIQLLLNHHRYQSRQLEFTDSEGKPMDVSLNPTVGQSIQNFANSLAARKS